MKVHKFGGTSLKDLQGFQRCIEIIQSLHREDQTVVVVSALYGVTDRLQGAIDAACNKQSIDSVVTELRSLHHQFLAAPETETSTAIDRLLNLAEQRLQGIGMLGASPDQVTAEVMGIGEQLSALLFKAELQHRGLSCHKLERQEALLAAGPVLDAVVDIEASRQRLQNVVTARDKVYVMPGFIAETSAGEQVLLGRNGSDYSAACAAAALRAEKCLIWKDLDGIMTANPALVPNAKLLPQVSYEEALELSYFGAKVIGAKAVSPLKTAAIPCEIRNVAKPQRAGTLINADSSAEIKGLSLLDGVALITISGPGLRGQVGFAKRAFSALAERKISVLLIIQSSSESSISIAIRQGDAEATLEALESEFHFERMHHLVSRLARLDDRSIISLVGEGLWHRKGVAAKLLSSVSAAGVNVEVLAQGSSERAISLAVKSDAAAMGLRACHDAFFNPVQNLDVALFGCGGVGSVLLDQIQAQQPQLAKQNIRLRVRAIANSRKLLSSENEIDLSDWRQQLETAGQPHSMADIIAMRTQQNLVNPAFVDCSANAELAARYPELISAGYNVIAANKHANTMDQAYYSQLRSLCHTHFRKFLYETNVGAGLPVIDTLQALIRSGDTLLAFNGILSGSLSLICGLLDDGMAFSQAVAEAKAKGFTEPDPREDLSGNDVARKLLVIAREVGMVMEMDDIQVEPMIPPDLAASGDMDTLMPALQSLDESYAERVRAAQAEGRVLRYVAQIEDGRCEVKLRAVAENDPMHGIRNGENALSLLTRYYTPIPMVLRGYGAGAEVTAAGVFGDLLRTLNPPNE